MILCPCPLCWTETKFPAGRVVKSSEWGDDEDKS
jgi:hypothetical protein